MKVRLQLKTCDIDDALKDAFIQAKDFSDPLADSFEEILDDMRKEYVLYNEYVTLEFDLVNRTVIVIKL